MGTRLAYVRQKVIMEGRGLVPGKVQVEVQAGTKVPGSECVAAAPLLASFRHSSVSFHLPSDF